MWSNRVFILSSLWFSLSFTFNCLHKHEKQCRQNFAVVIFIYYGPMTANVECCCKFRGLLHGKYHYIYIYIIYIYIYIFLVNQLISLKNTAQFHVVSCPISEKCVFLCNSNLVKQQPPEVFCKKWCS